jgi:hypothetical protein
MPEISVLSDISDNFPLLTDRAILAGHWFFQELKRKYGVAIITIKEDEPTPTE